MNTAITTTSASAITISFAAPGATLTINDPIATQPKDFARRLYKHQLACIARMQLLETKEFSLDLNGRDLQLFTNNGVLAERGGSGKSMTILGLIQTQLETPIKKFIVARQNWSYCRQVPGQQYVDTSLVILPDHLKTHWMDEVKTCGLKYHVVHKTRDLLPIENYANFDVVFICFDRLKNVFLGNHIFKRVFIDEADTAINSNKIPVGFFTWYITSNYRDFSRHPRFAPFKYMNAAEIDYFTVRTNYYIPPSTAVKFHSFVCNQDQLLSPDIASSKRCLLQENFIGAVLNLNGVVISQKDLIICISNEIIEKINKINLLLSQTDPLANHRHLQDIKSLRERKKTIQDNIKNPEDCGICLSKVVNPVLIGCCKNIFCAECISTVQITMNFRCPICRESHSQLCLVEEQYIPPPSKLSVCLDIIKASSGSIVVYTTSFEFYFGLLEAFKADKAIKFIQLDRTPTGRIMKATDDHVEFSLNFFNGLTLVARKVLLVAGSIPNGLSLSNTAHLIIDDNINQEYITDKIIRLDRDSSAPLNVHRLYREGDVPAFSDI
jgi:hypothetical protein